MSPQRKGSRRGSGWKAPRDRHEIVVAVLVGVAIVVATAALLWFVRPNRDSGSTSPIETITTPTTVAGDSSTTVPPSTTPTTTAPTEPSTP